MEDRDKTKKHKCYFNKGGHYLPCPGMNIMLDYCKIKVENILNFKTLAEYQIGVAIRPNKKKGFKGLFLNLCPFCGQNIINENNKLATDKVPYYKK